MTFSTGARSKVLNGSICWADLTADYYRPQRGVVLVLSSVGLLGLRPAAAAALW